MVETLLHQWGMEMKVGETWVRGLLQPVTGKLERLASHELGPLGINSGKRFLYIGPMEPQIEEGMTVQVGAERYLIRTAHVIPGDRGPVYRWAMCVEKGRDDDWGTSS